MTEGPFEVPPSGIRLNPDQWAYQQVLDWMREVLVDQRGYESTIKIEDVRPNPFVTALSEQALAGLAEGFRNLE